MKMFDADKTIMIWLPYGEKIKNNMSSCFHLIVEHQGHTDGDEQNCYINIVRQCVDTQ